MNYLNYKTVNRSKSVVVVAGGFSSHRYRKAIIEYCEKMNSIVIASNYNYEGIKADYTYFTDLAKLKENLGKVRSHIVLTVRLFSDLGSKKSMLVKQVAKLKKKGFSIYVVGQMSKSKSNSIYSTSSQEGIQITPDGDFPYHTLGTSGMGAAAISLIFKPKYVLLVGLDGPAADMKTKLKHDGKSVRYGKPKKNNKIRKYFSKSLIPTLYKKGVKRIDTFSEVLFYGLDKDKLGFNILE